MYARKGKHNSLPPDLIMMSGSFAIVAALFLGFTLNVEGSLDALDDDTKQMMAMLHGQCVGDTGVDEGLITKARTGEFADDDKLKTYMACVFQQTGSLSDDGVLDTETMISMLPDNIQGTYGKMINNCKNVAGNGAPEVAFKFNQCLYNTDPKAFFVI